MKTTKHGKTVGLIVVWPPKKYAKTACLVFFSEQDTLGMPEPELFEVIFEKRLELIAWLEEVGCLWWEQQGGKGGKELL